MSLLQPNIIASTVTDSGVTVALDRTGDIVTVLLDHPGLRADQRSTVAGHLTHEGRGFRAVSHGPAMRADVLCAIASLMED